MSFDLGGVVGALVGTAGAYLVARKSFRWGQRATEPDYLSRCLGVANQLSAILYGAAYKVMDEIDAPDKTLNQALSLILETTVKPLNELSIQAAAIEKELYIVIHRWRGRFLKIYTNNFPSFPFDNNSPPASLTSTEHTAGVLLSIMSEIVSATNEVEDLVKKYESKIML